MMQLPKLMHGKDNHQKKKMYAEFKNSLMDRKIGGMIEQMMAHQSVVRKQSNPKSEMKRIKQEYGFSDSNESEEEGERRRNRADSSLNDLNIKI